MDNLCHSLAGAAIAQAGAGRRLPRATLLGVVAANVPDVDALTYLWADPATAVWFRRGWTHGVLALVVWTVLLATAFDWMHRRAGGRRAPAGAASGGADGAAWKAYGGLAAAAVLSHPLLDLLNSYGVRLLMPFSDRWFYGDTLFIVDPPLLVIFAAGWFVSSRAHASGGRRPQLAARAALSAALAYIAAMNAMSASTRRVAIETLALRETGPRDLMVAPRPLMWLRRDVVVRTAESYDRYPAAWQGWAPTLGERLWSDPTGNSSAIVEAVRATKDGGRFLHWSRFPYFVPGTGADSGTIFVGDLRYSAGTVESWAGIRVRPGPAAAGVAPGP